MKKYILKKEKEEKDEKKKQRRRKRSREKREERRKKRVAQNLKLKSNGERFPGSFLAIPPSVVSKVTRSFSPGQVHFHFLLLHRVCPFFNQLCFDQWLQSGQGNFLSGQHQHHTYLISLIWYF